MVFTKSDGKAANFLSGYNRKSETERKKYDEKPCVRLTEKNDRYVAAVCPGNHDRYSISGNWLFDCMDCMVCYVYLITC